MTANTVTNDVSTAAYVVDDAVGVSGIEFFCCVLK